MRPRVLFPASMFAFACLSMMAPPPADAITHSPVTNCGGCSPYEVGTVQPAFSPSGHRLAVATANWFPPSYWYWAAVYVIDLDTAASDDHFGFGDHAVVKHPSWSPEGDQLVFSAADGLRLVDEMGQTSLLLQAGPNTSHPAWSPDGQTVAFEQDSNIWLVDAVGGSPVLLTQGNTPAWSPGGDHIAYSSLGDLRIIEVASGESHRVTTGELPSWSPDGDWLVYSDDKEGNEDIWLIHRSGGTPVRITSDPAAESDPDWSPDGRSIVYTRTMGDCSCIYLATDLPEDWTVAVEGVSWGKVKAKYRVDH